MRFPIWMAPENEFGFYMPELSPNEMEAMRGEGFSLEHEFEACGKENADAYFIAWCDNMAGVPNRVARIDFCKVGLK